MKVYHPYPGKGFLFGTILLLVLIAGFSGLSYSMYHATKNLWSVIPMGIVVLIIGGIFSYYIYIAKTLKYIIKDKMLIIQYGFSKKVIDLDKIGNLEIRNGITALKAAGAGWPGLHIGYYSMGGVGLINLFATRLKGDVVLFKSQWETIGLTPENPQEFIKDLKVIIPNIDTKKLNQQEMQKAKAKAEVKNKKLYRNLIIGNLIFILFTFLWISLKIPSLPDQIPMHIGPNGVDRYGSPLELYFLPLISTIIFVGSVFLARNKRSSATALYTILGFPTIMTLVMNIVIISLLTI